MRIPNEVIFAILRIIKRGNPGDLYYEAYKGHLGKRGETFYDIYHFNWEWAISHKPKSILEIGTRTGISLCQLLSGYIDHSVIQRVVCCDLFNDGFISPELVKYNLKIVGVPQDVIDKVQFLVGDSKKTVSDLPDTDKFDYILVDGDHSKEGARADLNNAKRLISKGGVIVFDDITPDGMDLLDVWNAFKEDNSGDFEWHEDMNGKGVGWCIRN
jgi:SAM-dependent methyltransferase